MIIYQRKLGNSLWRELSPFLVFLLFFLPEGKGRVKGGTFILTLLFVIVTPLGIEGRKEGGELEL